MKTLSDAASNFLAQKRIAVVGVSRTSTQPANFVFRKLRAAGHEVFPVSLFAAELEGTLSDARPAMRQPMPLKRAWFPRTDGGT